MKKWIAQYGLPAIIVAVSLSPLLALPPFYPDKYKLLVFRDGFGNEYPIRTPVDWARRRAHILENMQQVMGPLPAESRRVFPEVQVIEEVKEEKYTQKKLTFTAEKGDQVPCYLLIPHQTAGSKKSLPAVLCLHQTTRIGKSEPAGLGDKVDLQYAKHLAERGYVTLAPDYPNYGDYVFDPYKNGYESATMKGIWNHMRAVDVLQMQPEVDANKIGVIGHSLGGHNSLFVAVFDKRIKCIISSCGFCSFSRYYGGNLKGWSHNGYMPKIRNVYDLKPEKMPFDFTEVVAALAPRPFLACSPLHDANFDVQGVKECISAAMPVYELLGAKEKLSATYPDCAHEFPPEVRKTAYEWMDRWLK